MAPSDLRERVARAICKAEVDVPSCFEPCLAINPAPLGSIMKTTQTQPLPLCWRKRRRWF